MTEDVEDAQEQAGALRPLTACVAGAGVMTLGVLQFLGQVWSALPDPARQDLLATVRVAFVGFLLTLAALVLAWLGQKIGGTLWRGAISLFGLFAFAGSAYSVALGTGRALAKAAPETVPVIPPDGVLVFLALGVAALLLLVAVLAGLGLRHLLRRDEP